MILDFGLAKLNSVENRKERSIFTTRYIAHEVFSRQYGRLSNKSGMVILEMMGARKMENLAATGSRTFPNYLFDHLDELCSNITGERNYEAMAKVIKKMVILAMYCVQVYPPLAEQWGSRGMPPPSTVNSFKYL